MQNIQLPIINEILVNEIRLEMLKTLFFIPSGSAIPKKKQG